MRFRWWFAPGYLWSLPHTLVGLLLALVYRPTSWRWSAGCLEALAGKRIIGNPGAQTHGWLIYYRDERQRANRGLRVHERVHVLQGFLGGPLYVVAYSLHFLWRLAFGRGAGWRTAYLGIWAEVIAYRIQHEFNEGNRPRAWGAEE